MKILGKVMSVLYSIIFVVVALVLSIGVAGSNVLKGSFYTDVISSVELDEISAKDLGLSENEDESLEDLVANGLEDMGIPKDTAQAILNNEEIKEVVGDLIGKVVNYKINPSEMPQITKEEANTVLNNPEVKAIIGDDLSDADVNELLQEVNAFLKEFLESGGDF